MDEASLSLDIYRLPLKVILAARAWKKKSTVLSETFAPWRGDVAPTPSAEQVDASQRGEQYDSDGPQIGASEERMPRRSWPGQWPRAARGLRSASFVSRNAQAKTGE